MRTKFRYVLHIFSFFMTLVVVYAIGRPNSVAFAAERMYTFNMGFDGMQGSLILVESNGQWGLMDGGHRNAEAIQDATGRVISVPQSGQYSNQISMRNGKDVAQYMINQLGVTHLDFIVGTHSHMDHIGGIPEIATTSFTDASGRTRYLVDSSTTYFYKEYQHISDFEDDLARYSDLSWHNQAYYYEAVKTMQNRGANMVDVSKQQVIHGDPGNAYGDYVTFTMGNMSFRLYNVYEQTNTGNENVNSIVTVMTNGDYTVVNLADIDVGNAAIDRTSQAIGKDFGAVDVVVAGHHGYAGSNTKVMFDSLQPDFVVVSNDSGTDSWLYTNCDLAAAIPYAQGFFGTKFFSTAFSPYAIVTDFSGNQVFVYNLEGNGALTDAFYKLIRKTDKTGWVSWMNTNETLWSYLENGVPLRNTWKEEGGKSYYLGENGLMQTGWVSDNGGTRFCDADGSMATGWREIDGSWRYFVPGYGYRATYTWWEIDGRWYYFGEDGIMQTGWIEDEGGTRFCDANGVMATGWREIGGSWRYFVPGNGYRATYTWWEINGKKYYFGEDGIMHKGWIEDEGGTRFCDADGAMATGWREIDGTWRYFVPGSGYRATYTWWEIDGKWYYFGEDGIMHKGWIEDEGGTRFCDADGAMATGWREIDGSRRYFEPKNGYRVTFAWWEIDGKPYYFGEDGIMQTGWIEDEGGTRYYDADGIASGWKEIDGSWRYFVPESSYRATLTWWEIDGKWYYFGEDGIMHTGWLEEADGMRFCDADGAMAIGWRNIGDHDYYFTENGVMARNTVIDGYYVNENGEWVK